MRTPTTPTLTLLQPELIAKGKVFSHLKLAYKVDLSWNLKDSDWFQGSSDGCINTPEHIRLGRRREWYVPFGLRIVSLFFSSPHRTNMIRVLLCWVLPIARLCVYDIILGIDLDCRLETPSKTSVEFYCALNCLPKVWIKLNMKQQHPGMRLFYCDYTTVQKGRNSSEVSRVTTFWKQDTFYP